MPARPRVTDAFRQEFFAGHAEDQAWLVQRHASTSVPYGRVHDLLRSLEWSRLEPGVVSEEATRQESASSESATSPAATRPSPWYTSAEPQPIR